MPTAEVDKLVRRSGFPPLFIISNENDIGFFTVQPTIILTMLAQTSAAQTVISCTGIQGKAFYSQEGKWVDDGGTKIRLDLILNNDQFDISIGDLAGPTTIKSMGGQVYLLGNSDNKATILATYGNGHSELYTYDFNAKSIPFPAPHSRFVPKIFDLRR